MKNEEYIKERDLLIEAQGLRIPTKLFIDEFTRRLPEEDEIDDEGLEGDEADYCSWGFALYNEWVDAEEEVRKTNLLHWVEIYQGNLDDIQDIIDNINPEEDRSSLKPGQKVIFNVLGMESEISEGLGITKKEIKKLDGTMATVQGLETYTKLGDKDYEYYNIIFETNGYELYAVSGYHLDPIQ